MNNRPMDDNDMPSEIDFTEGVRGLHHIAPGVRVLMPVSIERGSGTMPSKNPASCRLPAERTIVS